ncbi:hypothetical protein VTO42DRAFT_1940 [Malbranchea cinnamomea]
MSVNATSRPSKRLRRACLNCRRKKVRCYGEQPACSFCARLGQQCIYPYTPSPRPESQNPLPPSPTPSSTGEFSFRFLDSSWSFLDSNTPTTNSPKTAFVDASDTQSPPFDWTLAAAAPVHNLAVEPDMPDFSHPMSHPPLPSLPQFESHPSARPLSSAPNKLLPGASPPFHSQQLALDTYFAYCHNQPYSFFHEETFRYQFAEGLLPRYLILALVASTLQFSGDPYYSDNLGAAANICAADSWKAIVSQCFDSEEGPSYRSVQALTLLAIYEFISCKHESAWVKIGLAVSIAQTLHMMIEPPEHLPCTTREEYRRTLWSIYLLDKLASCDRRRPSVFQDFSLRLQLPCSEDAFRDRVATSAPTLIQFKDSLEPDMDSVSPLARVIVVTSTVGRIAHYTLQQISLGGKRPPPWSHDSEYTALSAELTRYANHFDSPLHLEDLRDAGGSGSKDRACDRTSTGLLIFTRSLYHLCHCLLQHPFLLRQQFEASKTKFPTAFFAQAVRSNWNHAQKLTHLLSQAREFGYPMTASFYGYCSLLAGMINCLHSHSDDESIRRASAEAADMNLRFLKQHSKYFKNAARMCLGLEDFMHYAGSYHLIISPSAQDIELTQDDVERLYTMVDYGTMSTISKFSGAANFGSPEKYSGSGSRAGSSLANNSLYTGAALGFDGNLML